LIESSARANCGASATPESSASATRDIFMFIHSSLELGHA
jgi:hypothetical protein